MIEYPRLKLGNIREYTTRQKVLFPLFQTYTSSGMKVFAWNFFQEERTFFGCSRRRNMFVHTQWTVSCLYVNLPRVAKYLKDNEQNNLQWRENMLYVSLWLLSVRKSSQFSLSFALTKAFATFTIFSQPPLNSFKRDKNIGNFFVRSSF